MAVRDEWLADFQTQALQNSRKTRYKEFMKEIEALCEDDKADSELEKMEKRQGKKRMRTKEQPSQRDPGKEQDREKKKRKSKDFSKQRDEEY